MDRWHLVSALGLAISIAFETIASPIVGMGPRAAPTVNDLGRSKSAPVSEVRAAPLIAHMQLPAPSAHEAAAGMITGEPNAPIGFGRRPAEMGFHDRVTVPDGMQSVRIRVTSGGAVHLRIGLALADDASYDVYAYHPGAEASAVPSKRGISGGVDVGLFWTPVTEGDTQELLITRDSTNTGAWEIRVAIVSHIEAALLAPESPLVPKAAASCQVDISCLFTAAPAAMANGLTLAVRSVARMTYTKSNGGSYLCTGTLLNSANYPAPFFLTAAHCISTQADASSLTTFWHYQRDSCSIGALSPAMQQLSGGATLLYTNSSRDATLLGLNFLPPSDASYSGWNAGAVPADLTILAIHHPTGDVKKGSFGTTLGPNSGSITINGLATFAPGTFDIVLWQLGITEPGSSGSGLFSYDPEKNFFYVRGTLTGGRSSCTDSLSHTYYSRLFNYYADIAAPLTIAVSTNPQVVEYFHQSFGHYFVTANADEIAKLDAGYFVGWARTGQTFSVYPLGTSSAAGVCRFFSAAFAPKSSHFYTPSPTECAIVKTNPNWIYEALVFGFLSPSASGTCASGTRQLFRLYNNGMSGAPNHRYTTSTSIRSAMVAQGWIPEGAGALGVIGCVPA